MGITVNTSPQQITASVGETKIDVSVGGGLGPTGSAGPQGPAGPSYTLPVATASVLGGVKIGSGISIDVDGVISASAGYSLPIATAGTLGGVRIGSGISIDPVTGVISATAASVAWNDITGKPSTFTPSAHTHDFTEVTDDTTYTNFLVEAGGTLHAALQGIDSAISARALASDFDQGVKTTDDPTFTGVHFDQYAADWTIEPRGSLGGAFDFKRTISGVTETAFAINSDGSITFGDGTTQSTAASAYQLPVASALTLGGVTIGSGINVTLGQISVSTTSIGAAAVSHAHSAADVTSGTFDIARIPTGTSSTTVSLGNHTHSQLHDRSHAITSTSDHTAGNWKVIYTNGSGEVVELALGAANTVLTSNGTANAPAFQAVQGESFHPFLLAGM